VQDHRVKNTLATVQAIVGSTARTASSIDSFYEAFVGRIMSGQIDCRAVELDPPASPRLHRAVGIGAQLVLEQGAQGTTG
jgi:hypothetical protein